MCLKSFGGIISRDFIETITALVLFAIASTSRIWFHVREQDKKVAFKVVISICDAFDFRNVKDLLKYVFLNFDS
jgi:hypothetical protein